jgi:chemotaxis protein methyltransferase CheR
MIVHLSADPQHFRDWIAGRLGLKFDDSKLAYLAEVLHRLADKKGLEVHAYLDRLEGPHANGELQALAIELTVAETYFFRHIDQFHAFTDVALAQARIARSSTRELNILSAGCASGEEPYTLAMLVADSGWTVRIRALDVNTAMLAKAARGMYSPWALRETPAEYQRRWFRSVGKEFELEQTILAAVRFEEANLSKETSALSIPNLYDVIFCRNVLMYFTREGAQALVSRLTRSLAPGGHLFLGHAETLRGLSNAFHLCHTHGTFYYQRKSAGEGERAGEAEDRGTGSPDKLTLPPAFELALPIPEPASGKTWLETIQQASEHIRGLTDRTIADPALKTKPGAAVNAGAQIQLALELFKQERFVDALDLLSHLPAESERDPEVLLLRAALLTHSGNLRAAEHASAQLLARDEFNAGAHYLLALCREGAGDRQGAVDHDQAAIYLDSEFAMPRLHLGLMARRAGNLNEACRELGHALALLRREDTSRLLLFGGGFGREALVALCRSELKSAGGAS